MKISDMVKEWLLSHGYDGLVDIDNECGCSLDDFCPCGEPITDHCQPGYRHTDGMMYLEKEGT